MKVNGNQYQSEFVKLQNQEYFDNLKYAGQVHIKIMNMLKQLILDKTKLSLIELDKIVDEEIIKANCLPTFKNYKSFPNACCISVNTALVHGIPKDYHLQDGDLISFDFGVTYKGSIADGAITMIFGAPKSEQHIKLIETTKKCLDNAINSIKVGERIGVIGDTIYKTAKNNGFNVIEEFGGHGISFLPHDQPFISNKASKNDGVRFCEGMCLAIEPLLVPMSCSNKTKLSKDKWTVFTDDIGAHFEQTIFINNNQIEIVN